MDINPTLDAVLNRLAKWRSVFAGWQLGTRKLGDAECDAVRDHRELSLMLRIEVSALAALLAQKGIIAAEEFGAQLITEAEHMHSTLEQRFPGFKATEIGMSIDPAKAAETMKGWRP